MKERLENRILGAIRWVDAVTRSPIALPLTARSDTLRFTRNRRGLAIITQADGLEAHPRTFDLAALAPADEIAPFSLTREAEVHDPSGNYLPARFTLQLPRDPSPALLPPDNRRPTGSLFTPIDVALLPSPVARLAAGTAQVRVLIRDATDQPLPNAFGRVVSVSDSSILGRGLSDARGEMLIAVPGLKHFAPGATEAEVVTVETEARLEIIPPPPGAAIVDWTTLETTPVADGDTDPLPLRLRPGILLTRHYPFRS